MRLPPLPTTNDLLRLYGIRAKKALSQNFIMDPKILKKFVKTAGKIQDFHAIEVGPGPGGITRFILDAGVKQCHVIEKDSRFLPTLKMIQNAPGNQGRLDVSLGDCLRYNVERRLQGKVDPVEWDSPLKPNLVLFGNLPFNVASPFLIKLLRTMSNQSNLYSFGRMPSILTFQHEVALRMVAPPGDFNRCRLSVMVQNWTNPEYMYTLPGGAFVPPPEVDVGVVRLTPLRQPFIPLPFEVVDSVVNALFVSGKNRFVRNTLPKLFLSQGVDLAKARGLALQLLERCDLSPTTNAVQLTLEDIRSLCFGYQHMRETNAAFNSMVHHSAWTEDEAVLLNDQPNILLE